MLFVCNVGGLLAVYSWCLYNALLLPHLLHKTCTSLACQTPCWGIGEWVGVQLVSTEHLLHIFVSSPATLHEQWAASSTAKMPTSCQTGDSAVEKGSLTGVSLRSCVAADAMFTLTVWHMMGTPPTDPGESLSWFCPLLPSM